MPQPRRIQDQYFKKAKAEGYLARSAYKLLEIQERFKILPRHGRVLDLGCAPGSWLQVVAPAIGPGGIAVGVDLSDARPSLGSNVKTMRADVNAVEPAALVAKAGGPFDAVLSDMAPSTSGSGDDFLSARLCRRVLELLPALLRPGGSMVMKILEGADYPGVLSETKALFEDTRGFKPKASRDVSREMYIVARGYFASRAAPKATDHRKGSGPQRTGP